jgi:hypothetical protein
MNIENVAGRAMAAFQGNRYKCSRRGGEETRIVGNNDGIAVSDFSHDLRKLSSALANLMSWFATAFCNGGNAAVRIDRCRQIGNRDAAKPSKLRSGVNIAASWMQVWSDL